MRILRMVRQRGAAAVVLGCSLAALASAIPTEFRAPAPEAPAPDLIDINRAGAAELSLLPGVGPSLAQAIVADRTTNGRFVAISDIDRVRGVGPAALARISAFICAPAYAPQ
ncbi:MAG: helix-hairpin-helix domain-containing protein [Planctomycetota bacterium]|nr:MAG: helix-hairpin-helix domain-containing protein [Planctomycetota bacterium]